MTWPIRFDLAINWTVSSKLRRIDKRDSLDVPSASVTQQAAVATRPGEACAVQPSARLGLTARPGSRRRGGRGAGIPVGTIKQADTNVCPTRITDFEPDRHGRVGEFVLD